MAALIFGHDFDKSLIDNGCRLVSHQNLWLWFNNFDIKLPFDTRNSS